MPHIDGSPDWVQAVQSLLSQRSLSEDDVRRVAKLAGVVPAPLPTPDTTRDGERAWTPSTVKQWVSGQDRCRVV